MTVAVIFTSRRSESHDEEYAAVATRMEELAHEQPGFISITGVRDPVSREGITVSYFRDDDSARAWKAQAEHLHAQRRGIEDFYEEYSVTVAEVIRDYRFARP
ncbi:MAG: antibiotic biosynthesis monooxygenase [Actinomycetota bacterium]|nr:antibiotic biosynthesis monooxygenase [Actinomycetota bacterium]